MLTQLVEYAQNKQLVAEPGFAPKEIKWLISISSDARFTGIIQLGDGKKGVTSGCCPDLQLSELLAMPKALAVQQAAHFLADGCGVVTLLQALDKDGNAKTDSKSLEDHAKNTKKHVTFKKLIELASQTIPELEPIQTVISDDDLIESIRVELERKKAKPTDRVSFIVGTDQILEGRAWHGWWRNFRQTAFKRIAPQDSEEPSEARKPASIQRFLDLATAEPTTPANTHPKLTKLGVGAIAVGASLVGYDKEAFASYGLEAGENGAVSEETASAYRAALDSMLEGAPVLGQMKVAVWYDQEIPSEDNPFSWLMRDAEVTELSAITRAKALLNAIREGKKPESLAQSRFYALAISGASGRAMIRDWHTGNFRDLVLAVNTWFEDLEITNARGSRSANLPTLGRLLNSIQRPKSPETKYDDYIKPVKMLQIPFWHAALNPTISIPFAALTKIMESLRASIMTGELDGALKIQKGKNSSDENRASLGRIYARLGLLKAYHNREGDRMTPAFDPKKTYPPAFHCGRLMRFFAEIQIEALGDEVNAGVVQRYYGAASSTPELVLGRLARLNQHHLAKIHKSKPKLRYWLDSQIADVASKLDGEMPKTLTLTEQSLFALGYYQQLAFNRTKRSGNPDATEDDSASNDDT
jgi:CRISPR-associated protein Csd1